MNESRTVPVVIPALKSFRLEYFTSADTRII